MDKANRSEIKDNQATTLERLSNKEGSRGGTHEYPWEGEIE